MTRLAAVVLLALLGIASCGDGEQTPVAPPSWAKVAPEQIAEAKKHGVPVAFENDLGMRFVLIPAGTYFIGAHPSDKDQIYDQQIWHEHTISRAFYLQATEVTNEQYHQYRPKHDNGGWGLNTDGPTQPAVVMPLADARGFAEFLSRRDPRRTYRLPQETEWECACRAGTTTRYWWGEEIPNGPVPKSMRDASAKVADGALWRTRIVVEDSEFRSTEPVASFDPNPWGLYDMHGNVSEWCDVVGSPNRPSPQRVRPGGGVYRGRSFILSVDHPPSARGENRYGEARIAVGFRLVSPLPARRE